MARLSETGPGEVDRTRYLVFGDLAITWSVITRLDIVDDEGPGGFFRDHVSVLI